MRCGSIALDAAWGQAYPSGVGALLHCVSIAPGFAKVNVDGVYANFEVVPLEKPPNDEVVTLGQAIGAFIQWPKRDICLELPAPVSTSHEVSVPKLPAPVSTSQEVPAPKPLEHSSSGPRETSHASTPRARSTLVKSTYTKRGSKGKSKTIDSCSDIPFLPLARKFKLGEPLVERLDDPTLGYACTRLHTWYMEHANRTDEQRCSGVTVKFKKEHFNHEAQDCVFTVTFDDMFCLFNLDVSLMRCWIL